MYKGFKMTFKIFEYLENMIPFVFVLAVNSMSSIKYILVK